MPEPKTYYKDQPCGPGISTWQAPTVLLSSRLGAKAVQFGAKGPQSGIQRVWPGVRHRWTTRAISSLRLPGVIACQHRPICPSQRKRSLRASGNALVLVYDMASSMLRSVTAQERQSRNSTAAANAAAPTLGGHRHHHSLSHWLSSASLGSSTAGCGSGTPRRGAILSLRGKGNGQQRGVFGVFLTWQ